MHKKSEEKSAFKFSKWYTITILAANLALAFGERCRQKGRRKPLDRYFIMKGLHKITFILLIIGGLNWLLVGLFNWDVGMIFGPAGNTIAKIIYVLVGLSALVELFSHKSLCKNCSASSPMGGMKM